MLTLCWVCHLQIYSPQYHRDSEGKRIQIKWGKEWSQKTSKTKPHVLKISQIRKLKSYKIRKKFLLCLLSKSTGKTVLNTNEQQKSS